MRPDLPRAALAGVRGLIDGIDDGLLLMLAGRRGLVALAAHCKRVAVLPDQDTQREREVRRRAQRLGRRLGLPEASSERLMTLLIEDARGQQGLPQTGPVAADLDQGEAIIDGRILVPVMNSTYPASLRALCWRLLPPPARWAPLLRQVPESWQTRMLEAALRRTLAQPIARGALDALAGRRLGIEVSDLGLAWVVAVQDRDIRVCPPGETAEATVRGSATDLMLLASRREDADTLFFQRRLHLTGDTELGLTARNLLDQLPWEAVPLGLRIAMHRGAGLAQAARAAYRGESGPG